MLPLLFHGILICKRIKKNALWNIREGSLLHMMHMHRLWSATQSCSRYPLIPSLLAITNSYIPHALLPDISEKKLSNQDQG